MKIIKTAIDIINEIYLNPLRGFLDNVSLEENNSVELIYNLVEKETDNFTRPSTTLYNPNEIYKWLTIIEKLQQVYVSNNATHSQYFTALYELETYFSS
jgi:hypothetical protein